MMYRASCQCCADSLGKLLLKYHFDSTKLGPFSAGSEFPDFTVFAHHYKCPLNVPPCVECQAGVTPLLVSINIPFPLCMMETWG